MKISIISYKSILEKEKSFRLDAEYYSPDYLFYYDQIKKHPVYYLKKILHPTEVLRNYCDEGIQILLAQNVRNNELDFSNVVFMDNSYKVYLKKNRLKYNDVVLTRSGANFGQSAPFKSDKVIYACADVLVIKNTNEVKGGYLSTFLNSKQGKALLNRGSYGMAQPHIAPSYLYTLPIPRFHICFEEKIDQIVTRAVEISHSAINCYTLAEQLLLSELDLLGWKSKQQKSFIKNYSDTVTASRIDAEYFQPMYDEIVDKITSLNNFSTLDRLVSIKKCIEPGSNVYQDNGIVFLRISNLSKFGFKNGNQQYINDDLYAQLIQYQPKRGEILLTKDASPGIAYYLKDDPGKMIPSGGILRLKVKDENQLLPEYLTLVLNSIIVQKQIERDIGGSVINHWLVDQVKSALIPILPIDKQSNIAKMINKSFSNCETSKKLLDIAKRGVEMAIEQDENSAEYWIKSEIEDLGIDIDT